MHKLISIIACLPLLFACNSTGDKAEPVADTAPAAAIHVSDLVKIDSAAIPASIKFRGRFNDGWQWKDKLGDNILITSLVDPYPDKEKNEVDDGHTAEVHAFHFVKKDSAYKLLWMISDAEKSCPFDIAAEFFKGATMVTDLDSNGIAETTVQYKLACRSDVSPAYMKLIMHEDKMKYTLRGFMWIKASDGDKFTVTENDMNLEKLPKKTDEYESILQSFGRYETEKEFATAPAGFLFFARKQWMKFVKESFE